MMTGYNWVVYGTEVVTTSAGVDLPLPGAVMNRHLPHVSTLPHVVSRDRLTHWSHHAHLQLGEVRQKVSVRHPEMPSCLSNVQPV